MPNLWLVVFGLIGGIAGGMGMGGGTLLVPLLSGLDLDQKIIQAINLISFLPMSVVAVYIHNKHSLIAKNVLIPTIVPTVLGGVVGALLAGNVDNSILRICFAVYLLLVGSWQLYLSIKTFVKNCRRKKHALTVISAPPNANLQIKYSTKRL